MRIAVTGKIGSGKSTCAHALASHLESDGYTLLDVDALTGLVHKDPHFQAVALSVFGTLDRPSISKACFAYPDKRRALEQASLPSWTSLLHAGLIPDKLVVDFPLLMETQLACSLMDLVVSVGTHDEARETRACARLGWDHEQFLRVDRIQVGQRTKMAYGDIELSNDGAPHILLDACSRLARGVRDLGHIKSRVAPLIGETAWRMVTRAHLQTHRRYHGAGHLRALFDALDRIDPGLSDDPACALAICYHDYVYDTGPHYPDNEKLSTRILASQSRDLFPHLLHLPETEDGFGAVSLACALVDATKGHTVADPWIFNHPERLRRCQAFLDADLSVLGAGSEDQFWAYDEGIAEEFSSVPRPAYHGLRADAMRAFLDPISRPQLYLTPVGKTWVSTARRRLAELVDKHEQLALAPAPVNQTGNTP